MLYLDANVFILAITDWGPKGKKARDLLAKVTSGQSEACTSFLTWDEVVWNVRKKAGFEDSLNAGKAFLRMPGVRFIGVDAILLERANALIMEFKLHPRDAIHAASAIGAGAEMLSEDKDFDRVKGLKRKGL